jgi:predicted nucleic acid-binding protein
MRKLKLYLDTSVISHLDQPEKPSEYEYTHEFWQSVKANRFDIYLSEVVFSELENCKQIEKRLKLIEYAVNIQYTNFEITDEVYEIAQKIIKSGVLPPKSVRDSLHIACAIVANCDYILSWNMHHMSNIEVSKGIRKITIEENYKTIDLIPPSMLVERGE